MKIRVGHLYPDYLNIYADRGNIAVLAGRAAWRGHEPEVHGLSVGDVVAAGDGADVKEVLARLRSFVQQRQPRRRRI